MSEVSHSAEHLPLPLLAGEGWDGGKGEAGKQSIPPAARPCHFLLLVQEKVTKEKDTPALRFQHIHVLKVRRWRRAVSTARPCADETMADFLSATLRADPPPPAVMQGPRKSGGHPARVIEEAHSLRVLAEVALTERKATAHDETSRPGYGAYW